MLSAGRRLGASVLRRGLTPHARRRFASAKGGGVPTFAPLTTLYEGSSAYSSMLPPASGGADYLNLYEREGSKFLTLARFQFDEGSGS